MVIAAGSHLFPFRTEKLSPFAPMVLQCNVGESVAASFYESLEEKSSRLFFCCWVMGVDEVLRGERMGYYFGLIRLIWQIRLIRSLAG